MMKPSLDDQEDALTLYLGNVEYLIGDRLVLVEEADYERFFEHVIRCYERGLEVSECARTW